MRRWLPLVAIGLWSACAFDDSAPEDAVVQCTSNAECPAGWRCSSLRGVCLPRRDGDTVAPGLSGTVTPALARPGATVTVTVQADERLAGPPDLEVRTGTTTQVVEPAPDAGAWVFVVPADAPDQLLTFYASAEDLAGNGSQGVRLGTCLVDGTPPVVTSVRVTPARAAPGQVAIVTVLVSEEVEAGARLVVSTAAGAPLLELASPAATGALRFEVVVPQGTVDQALSLRVLGLVDLVGNPGVDTEAGSLEVDGTPPTIGALALGGSRYSAQPGFNVVTVPISVAEATLVSACFDQLCQSASPGQLVTFPVSGQQAEGSYTVTVRASDEVGNQAQEADVVVLDFSPPRVQSLRVAPAVVAPGGTVAVTASFDELLAADTALTVTSSDGSWTTRVVAPATGANLATFDVQLPAATFQSGAFHLRLSGAIDDVANAAPDLDAGSFLLDVDAPVFLPGGAGYPRRFSLQPGYDVLSVPTPPVTGAALVEVCLDADCRRFDGGVVAFAVSPDAGEGAHALVFRAFDEVGNFATKFDVVTFDFTPPHVLSSDVRYAPPANCPLLAVDAVTSGTGVTLEFATDEPLAGAPSPDAGALRLSLSLADDGSRAFTYAGTGPGVGLTTGPLAVTGVLADDVGNAALRALGQLTVDVTRPVAPAAAASGLFVYKRNPFGSMDTTYQPRFTVGADAGVFEPNLQVRFWSAFSGGLLMASGRSDAAGALPLTTLPPVDLPKLYFEAFDSACNAPLGNRRPVPGMELTATLGSKVPGASIPNPHRFVEEYVADPAIVTVAASREWGDLEVGRLSGAAATTMNPSLRWQGTGPLPGTIRCAWQDPVTAAVYVITNHAYRLESHGLVDLGPLPMPVQANCVTASLSGEAPGFLAASYYGMLTLVGGKFVHSYGLYDALSDLGWLFVSPSGGYYGSNLFAIPNQSDQYATAVWRRDAQYAWTEVDVPSPLPPQPRDRRNFTQYGPGYPLVVGNSLGGRETWALQPQYDGYEFEWVQLDAAPDDPAAVQHFNGEVVLVGRLAGHAWRLQSDGQWVRVADCPLQRGVVASFESRDGKAVMVGNDWSLAAFDGTTWSWLAAPPPALGGYRAQGHSPAVGTLAPGRPDAGLLLHTALADGGDDATWTWDGTRWTPSPGTSPPMAAGVAALGSDGTVVMLGKATLPDAGMLTFRHVDGGWVRQVGATPSARVDHRLVLDRNNRLLAVGGSTLPPASLPVGGVYAYQATGNWLQLSADTFLPRARPAVGTDPRRGVTVMFGGSNGSPLQDTWELTSTSTWQVVPTPASPSARAGASFTWDPLREHLVLTGGTSTPDTWVYDGTWRDMTPWMGAPPASSLTAWDATSRAIASLGVPGDAFLAPTQVPAAHRFIVTDSPAAFTQVVSGQVRASATASGLSVSLQVWNGAQWSTVGQASVTPVALTADETARALANGVRIAPAASPAQTPTQLRTDYVEFVTRYLVIN